MKKDDQVYLVHILEAITKIERYTCDLDIESFLDTDLIQDAVIRQLEIIGEAAKNVSQATRSLSSDIPWKDMAGMRDILIHQYFGVDLHAVWDTVVKDLPDFRDKIAQLTGKNLSN